MNNSITEDWRHAINGWIGLLKVGGATAETMRARRGVVGMISRNLNTPLAQVTSEDVIGLCGAREWSNDYRRGVRTSLIQFFNWAIKHQLHPGPNPAEELPKVPESTPRPRPVTDDIWVELLAAAKPRERLMARLAGEAGLRRAEVAQVRKDDLVPDLGGWSLIVNGKGGKQRTVPITDSLAEAIRSHQHGWSPHGYLFPGKDDGHLSPNCVGKLISDLLPPGWSMHKLRHRYASRGFAGTGNIRAVQEALGHASVATTQRYTAVTSRDVRAVSESAA